MSYITRFVSAYPHIYYRPLIEPYPSLNLFAAARPRYLRRWQVQSTCSLSCAASNTRLSAVVSIKARVKIACRARPSPCFPELELVRRAPQSGIAALRIRSGFSLHRRFPPRPSSPSLARVSASRVHNSGPGRCHWRLWMNSSERGTTVNKKSREKGDWERRPAVNRSSARIRRPGVANDAVRKSEQNRIASKILILRSRRLGRLASVSLRSRGSFAVHRHV